MPLVEVHHEPLLPPSAEDFRKVGFTAAAINFPLTLTACDVIAELNGIPVNAMPLAWSYAPNAYMQRWMEWLGVEHKWGRPIRDPDGRVRREPEHREPAGRDKT